MKKDLEPDGRVKNFYLDGEGDGKEERVRDAFVGACLLFLLRPSLFGDILLLVLAMEQAAFEGQGTFL